MNSKPIVSALKGAVGAVPEAYRRHYGRLLQLRETALKDADGFANESGEPTASFVMHMAEAATDSFDHELALSVLAFEQDAVGEIDAALKRIREGTYGVCECTGKMIPRRRLEAIPWARCTAEAQAEIERKGDARCAHRNENESIDPQPLGSQ